MAKLWAGRTDGVTSRQADDFNSSIRFDSRMYREDITGSVAHAKMLAKCSILSQNEAQEIIRVCGRALVMYHGDIRAEVRGESMNEANMMRLATGG